MLQVFDDVNFQERTSSGRCCCYRSSVRVDVRLVYRVTVAVRLLSAVCRVNGVVGCDGTCRFGVTAVALLLLLLVDRQRKNESHHSLIKTTDSVNSSSIYCMLASGW